MVVGLIIRLGFAYQYKWDQPVGVNDSSYYHLQANALAKGLGFVDPWRWALFKDGVFPGAEHPPLYSLFLAVPSTLGFDTYRQHVIASCILGAATCGIVAVAGRAIAGPRVGVIAGILAAVYVNVWLNDTLLLSETLAAALVAAVVWRVYRYWSCPTRANAVWLGACLGLLALTRAESILYLPLVAVPLVLRSVSLVRRERVMQLGLVVLLTAVPVTPWLVRNMTTFEKPVFLSTGDGFALAMTNCDPVYYGKKFAWWEIECLGDRWSVDDDEAVQSDFYRQRAFRYIGDNLDRLPVVALARFGYMWELYNPLRKLDFDAFEQGRNPLWLARVALAQYYVLLALAAAGVVLLRRRKIIIYPLLALAVVATVAAMSAFGNTRYRVPAEIGIVLAAAVAIVAAYDRWWRPSRTPAAQEAVGSEASALVGSDG